MNATAYRLRELRKKRGLSQQQVANILGISRTAYNKYEHGVIQPVRKLKELTALFGVTADYILGRDGIELEDNTQKISPHAHRQVKKYLNLSDEGQDIVNIMLDAIYEREHNSESSKTTD